VLATNPHRDSIAIKMNTVQLDDYFGNIVSSHDFGYLKEELAFWDKLAEVQPYDPATSLFIDYNLEVLATAEAFGIQYLIAIKQPDSSKPEQDTLHYHAISDFSQIMTIC